MRAALLPVVFIVLMAPVAATAHGLDHTIAGDRAVVVTLTYDDGAPFSFETCEVTPPAADAPSQVGRTDRRGRVVFLADRPGDWRVRVVAQDGHGADLTVPIGADLLPSQDHAAGPTRPVKLVTGVSVLFGIFGVVALLMSRRKP
ncbi:MAG: ABC transporter permease [bacterium]|nr:ABC transporter permease [bacterium]